MASFEELMAQIGSVKGLVKSGRVPGNPFKQKVPKKYEEPYEDPFAGMPYSTFLTRVLTPVGFSWGHMISNWYPPHENMDFPHKDNGAITFIIHSHSRERKVCSAIDLCHVLGYRPTGEEHPIFLHSWKEKFNYVR